LTQLPNYSLTKFSATAIPHSWHQEQDSRFGKHNGLIHDFMGRQYFGWAVVRQLSQCTSVILEIEAAANDILNRNVSGAQVLTRQNSSVKVHTLASATG